MEPKDLSKVPTMEEFNRIKKALNLTDRQKKIFYLKYSRHMRIADIAAEVDVHRDTVYRDLTDIREKVLAVEKEQLLKQNEEGADT